MGLTWTLEQKAIFEWFKQQRNEHLVVLALAGTGKTTTIIEGVNLAPERKIVVCAFNKSIATELQNRVTNPNVTAKTLHAIGFGAIMRFWSGVKPDFGNARSTSLAERACGTNVPTSVISLVAKLCTKGREMAPHAKEFGDLTDILYQFECEPDEAVQFEGYDAAYIETKALLAMELATERPADNVIDGADMIYLPLRNNWLQKSYDLVVVDEAQDMTKAQLEIAQRICRGRICLVGDPNQAIYGFRGADSESLGRLQAELNARVLGLTVTYRCGRAIVEEAQRFVPSFTAADTNPEGAITNLPYEKLVAEAQHGDFVISRTNAPLVSTAMALLRSGKRARIAGRDIGAGLKAIIRKLAKGKAANSIPAFLEAVSNWEDRQVDRYLRAKKEGKVDEVRDQAAMLVEFAVGATSVSELGSRIDMLFEDDGRGMAGVIRCSSVHRVKGLEANHVFVLKWTLRLDGQEEKNIYYVAVTRAKHELTYVAKAQAA